MKKWFCFLTALVLLFALAVPAFADEMDPPDYESATADAAGTDVILFDAAEPTSYHWDGTGVATKVVDEAGTFSAAQIEELQAKCAEITKNQAFDVGVFVIDSMSGSESIQTYADMLFLKNNYGIGTNGDGCLLLLVMSTHDWYVSTHGYGITAITDAGREWIAEGMKEQFRKDNYFGGVSYFLEQVDRFVTQAKSGEPFDVGNLPKAPFGWVKHILIALAIGFIISLIVVNAMKKSLKSVHLQSSAANYQRQGSLNVRGGQEFFLYTSVSRTPKPKPSETRSGGGGGGSSTHSTGGSTFGGGGGKW